VGAGRRRADWEVGQADAPKPAGSRPRSHTPSARRQAGRQAGGLGAHPCVACPPGAPPPPAARPPTVRAPARGGGRRKEGAPHVVPARTCRLRPQSDTSCRAACPLARRPLAACLQTPVSRPSHAFKLTPTSARTRTETPHIHPKTLALVKKPCLWLSASHTH
jgi:hypothetical protein